uniref:hypothetical protein n=1 Tax=Agathobacter sp. TaxID=2021311 RepID=UPI0040576FCA
MIWKQEAKKLIKHPMLWSLLVFFLLCNGLLLWGNIGDVWQELQWTHKAVLEHGADADVYRESLSRYDTLDMVEIKELKQELYQYYPSGSYQKFVDKRYETLNARVKEIVESGEAEDIAYVGMAYRLHNKLYAKVLRWVFLEMVLFILVAVLFLMDYERINHTLSVTYATHVGRTVQWIKWCVGMAAGLGMGMVLLGSMLMAWFWLIPYEGFWNTSISAALMTEPRGILTYPFITFHKMTILQYLLSTIAVGIFLAVIVGMVAGVIQIKVRNSYLSFGCVMLFLLMGLCISGCSTQSWLDIALSWNPADLWFRMGNWFMEGSLAGNFEGAEVISIAVQMVFWGIVGKKVYRGFLVRDD